jgi:hypothetical protein
VVRPSCRPRIIRGRRESRVPAVPEAPYVKSKMKRTSFSHQQVRRTVRLSLHNGLTAYSALSPVGHCATVIATNALRLVTRSDDFDFAATSTQALSARTTRLHRTPTLISAVTTTGHRLQRTLQIGFAHSGNLRSRPILFGVHCIPARVRDDRDPPLCGPERLTIYASCHLASSVMLRKNQARPLAPANRFRTNSKSIIFAGFWDRAPRAR